MTNKDTKQTKGFRQLYLILALIIGTGIYNGNSVIFQATNSAMVTIGVWLIAGIVFFLTSLIFYDYMKRSKGKRGQYLGFLGNQYVSTFYSVIYLPFMII